MWYMYIYIYRYIERERERRERERTTWDRSINELKEWNRFIDTYMHKHMEVGVE